MNKSVTFNRMNEKVVFDDLDDEYVGVYDMDNNVLRSRCPLQMTYIHALKVETI